MDMARRPEWVGRRKEEVVTDTASPPSKERRKGNRLLAGLCVGGKKKWAAKERN